MAGLILYCFFLLSVRVCALSILSDSCFLKIVHAIEYEIKTLDDFAPFFYACVTVDLRCRIRKDMRDRNSSL